MLNPENMIICVSYMPRGPKGPGVYYRLEEKLPAGGLITHDTVGPFNTPAAAVTDLYNKKVLMGVP